MIATLMSRIFDPFIMLGIAFVVLIWGSPIFIPAFFVMVLLPILLFIVAWKTKVVSNWDVTDRRERPKILWTLVAIETIFTILFRVWAAIPILIILAGFALITHWWKMSGHVLAVSLATGTIIHTYGWRWWPILLIVPLVGWARVVTKNHTIWQVIAGALYSWFLLAIMSEL